MLNVLDLFSGIGGFSLGLERTGGFQTVAFCEQDTAAQNVLKKHWPHIPVFDDVRLLTKAQVPLPVHVIAGGFPCQDISIAGHRQGIVGERSGLWSEYKRLIKEFQPQYAIIENVSALRANGLALVLQDLCEIGYDAEWNCIPAAAVGATQERDRLWIVAYRKCEGSQGRIPRWPDSEWQGITRCIGRSLPSVPRRWVAIRGTKQPANEPPRTTRLEPRMGRNAHGVSGRMDRLKQLGNTVVPQIPELIGRAILEMETHDRTMRA